MKLDTIFKRLILVNVFLAIVFIIAAWNVNSQIVLEFNDNFELQDELFFLILFWIIAYFVSCYLLYNFKKFGRQLFLIVFILGYLISLLSGPIAFDQLTYVLDSLGTAVNGALLVILYFTPISKKF
jgi:hypothetical protein